MHIEWLAQKVREKVDKNVWGIKILFKVKLWKHVCSEIESISFYNNLLGDTN